MGRALSKIKKPIRDFNLERRVEKALDAPKQKTPNARQRGAPDTDLFRKDDKLIGRVNQTHLTSQADPTTPIEPHPGSRPQLSREPVVDPEFGYYNIADPNDIPAGRTTLPRLLEMLGRVAPPHMSGALPAQSSNNNNKPQNEGENLSVAERKDAASSVTEDKISALVEEYRLTREQVAAITSRFRLLDLHIPNPRTTTVKRMQILSEQLRMGNATTLSLDDEDQSKEPPQKQIESSGRSTPEQKKKQRKLAAGSVSKN